MRKLLITLLFFTFTAIGLLSFVKRNSADVYRSLYFSRLDEFISEQNKLLRIIEAAHLSSGNDLKRIREQIILARVQLKKADFWLRYFEPTIYKKINGPLPVEWETEVFEKFEKPYKREGAGLTLAFLYLEEDNPGKDSLFSLVSEASIALKAYLADSIAGQLATYHHFYLCNRLYLLNLAAIYTTGFECPDAQSIIPELREMMNAVREIYTDFNLAFPGKSLGESYLELYNKAIAFVNEQQDDYEKFDHYRFIRDYVNPLYRLNQQMILGYKVATKSMVDYSINKSAASIFSKELYFGQNEKGIFLRVSDSAALREIDRLGKLLFYDPILSANNQRSCASCHKPDQFFTDTISVSAPAFNKSSVLPRNTPTLVNAIYNHLLMADGKHISLTEQVKGVVFNPLEMAGKEKEILKKVMSCPDYKSGFEKLLAFTPAEEEISINHLASAITYYYGKFSRYQSLFDESMNKEAELNDEAKKGFNVFMSKAQCATCHFVPQFNGVKPPYVGSEFEVLGVPENSSFSSISDDLGRYLVNPAKETLHAFRTGSLRNSMHTAPYMHNGVFKTMDEVIDFYDAGGGIGKGLHLSNQTLGEDSLHLTSYEKKWLLAFLSALDEKIVFEKAPEKLPKSNNIVLNKRKVGGIY
jgi:cytochrome c peroxidase